MLKRIWIVLGLALLAGRATAACVADSPLATARWIFDQQGGFAVFRSPQDKQVMQSFLSPALFNLLQAEWRCQVIEEGLCAIDNDPWLNSDVGQVLDPVTFEIASMPASHATVEMRFRFGSTEQGAPVPEPAKATLWLVKDSTSGCWLLDDLVGRQGQSLRKVMENYKFYPSQG